MVRPSIRRDALCYCSCFYPCFCFCLFRISFCVFHNVVYLGLNVDVANFLGLKEINVALNVLLAVALVVVLVTLIETRIQLIGRIGKCAMSVRWSVGRLHGW